MDERSTRRSQLGACHLSFLVDLRLTKRHMRSRLQIFAAAVLCVAVWEGLFMHRWMLDVGCIAVPKEGESIVGAKLTEGHR